MSTLSVQRFGSYPEGFTLSSEYGEALVVPTPDGFECTRWYRPGEETVTEHATFGDGEEALLWAEEML